jgi:CHAT domain-containing protein
MKEGRGVPETFDQHITDDQIQDWIGGTAISAAEKDHLDRCPDCRGRENLFRSVQDRLALLRTVHNTAIRTAGCPTDDIWWRVAIADISEPGLSEAVAHASKCSRCAAILRTTVEDIRDEEHSGSSLQKSPANSPTVEMMASQLQREAFPQRESRSRRVWYVSGAIAAAAIIATAYAVLLPSQVARTNHLLAQAYQERRTIAMRFPDAGYSVLRQERGSGSSEPPRVLLEADLTLARLGVTVESEPEWLEIKGRAALLRWDYDKALEAFELAQSLPARRDAIAAQLHADLGIAYFERGEALGRGADYSAAAEQISKAIAIQPGSAQLHFNRALAYERLFFFTQAIADWKESIRLEPSGLWSEEARSHVKALEEKQRGTEVAPPSPHAYLEQRSSGLDSEFALRPAFEGWLQLAGRGDSHEALPALKALAADLERQHTDMWLTDMLPALTHPLGRKGYLALADAVRANGAGQSAAGEAAAREAAKLFTTIGNRAGVSFARYEEAYSQQRAIRRVECAKGAGAIAQSIPESYRWLRAALWTESGVCRYHAGDLGNSWRDLSTALDISRAAGYHEASFRVRSFQNDFRAELGDSNGAWESNLRDLAETWAGSHEAVTPFHFYSGIVPLASRAGNWNTALAATREAINALSFLTNPSILAVHHYQAASFALSAGQVAAAADEFELAHHLFAELPPTNQARAYLFNSELGRAEAEARIRNVPSAHDRLQHLSNELEAFSDTRLQLRYHALRGEIARQQGDFTLAGSSLAAARALAAEDRKSLHDLRHEAVWMTDNRGIYRTLLELNSAKGDDSWAVWREYHGGPIPSEAGDAISFAVLPDRVESWVRIGNRLTAYSSTITEAELELLVVRFRRACGDPSVSVEELKVIGRRLGEVLLGPVQGSLRGRIQIEPDGPLAGIPWEALTMRDGHWAGEKATFVVAIEGVHMPEGKTVDRNSHVLIVASPAAGAAAHSFPPLPGALRESRVIAAFFRHAKVLTGTSASFAEVHSSIPGAEVFHFAGHHGQYGLLLSDTGGVAPDVFNVGAFAALNTKCHLAVLSACRTSTTNAGDEWDPDTLIRAFHRAGVSSVVASRWSVDSERTADLMTQFYERLLAGSSIDVALQQASRYLSARPDSAHPYYWAAFADFVR